MILSICEVPEVLSIMRVVRILITIIRIAVPIILIVILMIDFLKAITDKDADALAKAGSHAIKRVIAAVLIFFVPLLVKLVSSIAINGVVYRDCIDNATTAGIRQAYRNVMNDYIAKYEKKPDKTSYENLYSYYLQIKDESVQKEFKSRVETIKNYQEGKNSGTYYQEDYESSGGHEFSGGGRRF